MTNTYLVILRDSGNVRCLKQSTFSHNMGSSIQFSTISIQRDTSVTLYPVAYLNTAHGPRPAKRVCMFVPFLLSTHFADLERVLFSGESICFLQKKGALPSDDAKVGLVYKYIYSFFFRLLNDSEHNWSYMCKTLTTVCTVCFFIA